MYINYSNLTSIQIELIKLIKTFESVATIFKSYVVNLSSSLIQITGLIEFV